MVLAVSLIHVLTAGAIVKSVYTGLAATFDAVERIAAALN